LTRITSSDGNVPLLIDLTGNRFQVTFILLVEHSVGVWEAKLQIWIKALTHWPLWTQSTVRLHRENGAHTLSWPTCIALYSICDLVDFRGGKYIFYRNTKVQQYVMDSDNICWV